MKDLVIGVFSNYGYDDVKPWVLSIKQTGFSGDVVLVALDAHPGTKEALENQGVICITGSKPKNSMVHMERFSHIYNYLNLNSREYRYVVSTDVRDVIFQKNPFEFMEQVMLPGIEPRYISSGEAIRIKDEPWNRNNIIKNFGQHYYNQVAERVVQNVGILAGHSTYMRDLCFFLYQMSLNRPDWVADQAAYNMIINMHPFCNRTLMTDLSDAWAINAHVTNFAQTRTQFAPVQLEPSPTLVDGQIVNDKGRPFYIVHQYDRVMEWKKFYEKKYEVKIFSQYTPEPSDDYIVIRT